MIASGVFDRIPLSVLFVGALLLAIAAIEAGRWLALRRKLAGSEAEATVGASVGATLGLLAFTLAFTFGMAAERFDVRKAMVVAEANAIGTAYLRTSFVPQPSAGRVREALREYVDVRLDAAAHPERFAAAMTRIEELQAVIWKETALLGANEPTPVAALFIQSINEMIDIHGERLAALRNKVPSSIWVFLFVTATVGMLSMGYHAGLSGTHRSLATLAVVVAFSGVILLIADLDRPQQGLLQVSQQAMIDQRQGMKPEG